MANKRLNILVRVDVIHVNILVVRTCGDHKKNIGNNHAK